jgi:hypothetical protein
MYSYKKVGGVEGGLGRAGGEYGGVYRVVIWRGSDIAGSRGPGGLYCRNAEERQVQMMVTRSVGVGRSRRTNENTHRLVWMKKKKGGGSCTQMCSVAETGAGGQRTSVSSEI